MPADPRTHLPLKPVELELLLALADEERHGYGLVQAISERTDGLLTLDPGNLYRVIKRLLAEGLVAEAGQRSAPDEGGERRRYYRITPLGGRVSAELSAVHAHRAPTPAHSRGGGRHDGFAEEVGGGRSEVGRRTSDV
jgi:DNA-binding PadR family transcriptional regulator